MSHQSSTEVDKTEGIELNASNGQSTDEPTPNPSTTMESREVLRELHEFAALHKIKRQFELIREFKNAHKQSMFEVKLTLGTETYNGEGSSIKAAQRVAATVALSATTLPKPSVKEEMERSGVYSAECKPQRKERRVGLLDDPFEHSGAFDHTAGRYFERRLKEIVPTERQHNEMHILLREVEHCLKYVSDSMTVKAKELGIRICDPSFDGGCGNIRPRPDDEFRILKGVMRVGNMAKNIMLSCDKEICLVLLCARKPSLSLMNEVCAELQQVQPDFCLVTDENEACLRIEYNSSYQAKVFLSSILLREENFKSFQADTDWIPAPYADESLETECSDNVKAEPTEEFESADPCDETGKEDEQEAMACDIPDALPLDMCLYALSEVRHAKWFQVTYVNRSHALDVLRLIRDLQQIRPHPWALIPQYAFELLLQHCATSGNPNPPIVWIFRKLLEILSSGILYDTSLGVYDPCECRITNVLANIPIEHKDAMTREAQYCLRLLVFRRAQDFIGVPSENTD